MKTSQTANQLMGRATGSMVLTGFGSLWLVLSLYARHLLRAGAIAAVGAGFAVLLTASLVLFRRARLWPREANDPRLRRNFNLVNVIQWSAIFVTLFVLARLHLDVYSTTAITAIVGLHMFPLARLFHYPLYHAAGALLVIWAAACAVIVPAANLESTTGMGTGVILWFCAAVTLTISLQAARQRADIMAY